MTLLKLSHIRRSSLAAMTGVITSNSEKGFPGLAVFPDPGFPCRALFSGHPAIPQRESAPITCETRRTPGEARLYLT